MSTTIWNGKQRRLHIQEVGPRDGLQMESVFVDTEDKIALIDALSDTGVSKIEVTAFVSAQAIPALKDAEAVLRRISRRKGVTYSALVPNLRGAQRALEAGADEFNLVMSATNSHNLSNLRMLPEQSFAVLAQVAQLGQQHKVGVNVSLSCAFGCPMEGEVDPAHVLQWCTRFVSEWGVSGVSLCDTTGMAHPAQVHSLVAAFKARWPDTELTLHFHNTRGMGLCNVLAAIDAGASRFDTSVGGLGGCPYAPGASGNVCTEDIVHALHCLGYDTGVNLEALLTLSRRLPALLGHDTPSALAKAGHRLQRHPVPAEFEDIRQRALQRLNG